MAAMDLTLGPILLGTILNIWLYGIMVTQTTMYYVAFPRDHRWIKILVGYMFAVDTLNSIFDIGLVWKYTITLFGDHEGIRASSWWFNVEPVMTVMVSSSTQAFFAWRIAKLTGHAWMGWAIAFSALVQFIAGVVTSVGTFIVRDFDRFLELRVSVTIWLALSALTDVVITCILSWYLHTHRTGFSKTDDVITRLVRLTVQTGLLTTLWAAADLISYLGWANNMHLFFQLPLCKLYTNSLMSTLNSRAGWGGSFTTSTGNPDPMSRSAGELGTGQPQFSRKNPTVWRPDQPKSQQTTAIQIVTTATVHRDDGFELEEYGLETKRVPPEDVETLGLAESKNVETKPRLSPDYHDNSAIHDAPGTRWPKTAFQDARMNMKFHRSISVCGSWTLEARHDHRWPMYNQDDELGSDDLEGVLELSLQQYQNNARRVTGQNPKEDASNDAGPSNQPSYLRKNELQVQLSSLDAELVSIDAEIQSLQEARRNILQEKEALQRELATTRAPTRAPKNATTSTKATGAINYADPAGFEWTDPVKKQMRSVFGIKEFRLCQEGVVNAVMDGRDVVCVMPTGGGKSLTYQLPALVLPGCTLVISPLVALIMDQVMHLRENGIEAVMLTGATGKEETRSIMQRLAQASKSKGIVAADMGGNSREKEIKLCYVTPEKIAKSKIFTSTLEKMCTAGRLARIVIDEAHCVSQLGHDFRPDYKKLSILRQLFPNVPITALSATCPPKVLKDLLMTLRMRQVTDGNNANASDTVYFSAPLYRKNLHYSVLPKPASAAAAIQVMADYITQNHAGHSGIVYCLSKKDTETVAEGLSSCSKGAIRTGVYHADIGDHEKESLHIRWRNGEVQVVCATIAFGLGIDKSNVRFVLHHSMSKSLDGFYQESGRAGRDGNDSDCVLYYRGQDATRLSSLICGEIGGQEKLHDMLRFAQSLTECRKLLFANYFSASSSLSLSSWTTEAGGKLTPCGHCDNCTRPPETVTNKDVTLDAWIILRVVQTIDGEGGRVTVGMLADLVRGVGGKAFQVPAGGGGGRGRKRKSQGEKVGLDLEGIAGGKASLSKDDAETLIIQLVLSGHLKEIFHSTAYAINVYLQLGPQAARLTRLSREAVQAGSGPKVECAFIQRATTKSKAAPKKQAAKASGGTSRKGKSKAVVSDEDEDEDVEDLTEQIQQEVVSIDSEDLEDADEDGWSYSIMPRRKSGQDAKPSTSGPTRKRRKIISDDEDEFDDDVIVLSP